MAKPRKVILKKSNVLLNGQPKLPEANAMEYGELAVNYAASGETLSIKNSDNQIVTFPGRPAIEKLINEAVSGLPEEIQDIQEQIVDINSGMSAVSSHIGNSTIHLPAVTSSDNGKTLKVVNGVWSAATPLNVYSGSNAPDNSLGNNGDIYLQTS